MGYRDKKKIWERQKKLRGPLRLMNARQSRPECPIA